MFPISKQISSDIQNEAINGNNRYNRRTNTPRKKTAERIRSDVFNGFERKHFHRNSTSRFQFKFLLVQTTDRTKGHFRFYAPSIDMLLSIGHIFGASCLDSLAFTPYPRTVSDNGLEFSLAYRAFYHRAATSSRQKSIIYFYL